MLGVCKNLENSGRVKLDFVGEGRPNNNMQLCRMHNASIPWGFIVIKCLH